MKRRAIPEIAKKRLFQEAGSKCPNCQEADVSALQIHHIRPLAQGGGDDEGNLIVLCSNCHSKVTAGEISENDILRLKISLMKTKTSSYSQGNGNIINFPGGINRGIIASELKTNKLEINSGNRKIKMNPPAGSIASSLHHKNYIKHLIDRYHQFKKAEIGKEEMKYFVFYNAIKRKFGAKWDMIELDKFDPLSAYIKERIDKTILGKKMKADNRRRYSTFEEFIEK